MASQVAVTLSGCSLEELRFFQAAVFGRNKEEE